MTIQQIPISTSKTKNHDFQLKFALQEGYGYIGLYI